jgi:hypothetical protein
VSCIEQPWFGQVRDRTSSPISGKNRIAKGSLMKPNFDFTKGIATLWTRWHGSPSRSSHDRPESAAFGTAIS